MIIEFCYGQVDRRAHDEFSYDEFVTQYVEKRRPVVITGYGLFGPLGITRELLLEKCGDREVQQQLDKYIEDTVETLGCAMQSELDCRLKEHNKGGLDAWLASMRESRTLRGCATPPA